MTQIALYRRYRPQTFEDVLGQEHVTDTLRSAIRDERIHHAYLFSGSRGTGKTSTARILAKALNCEKGPTPDPCNTCDTCRAITDGSSLDVIEIDAASHGGVDDVRELRDNVLLAPAASRKKIYIVDEAHMVSTQGWNAFLKTVEEPPGHVIFVFATTEPHKVLPTILSRCQRFDFRRVSSQTIAGHLAKVCADEGIAADDAALHLIARSAEGGVRDALSVLDQLAASGQVGVDDAARLLGVATSDLLFDFAGAIASSDTASAVTTIARLVDEGHDLRVVARTILDHLRALLLVKQVPDPGDLIDVTPETRERLVSQAESFTAGRLVYLMRLFVSALEDMRQQTPPRMAMELAVVRATLPEADETAAAAIARIERLERLLEVGGVSAAQAPAAAAVPAAPDPAPPAAAPAKPKAEPKKPKRTEEPPAPEPAAPAQTAGGIVDVEMVRRSWPLILEEIRKASRRVHAFMLEGNPAGFEDGTLVIETRFAIHSKQIAEPKNAGVVASAINAVLGVAPRISTRVGGQAPEPEEAAEEPDGPIDPDAVARNAFGDDIEIEDE